MHSLSGLRTRKGTWFFIPFTSVRDRDPDPPGSEIIWPQGFGSEIINFGPDPDAAPDPEAAPDPDPPLFHTKLRNMF